MKKIFIFLLALTFSHNAFAFEPIRILKKNYNKYYALHGYNAEGKAKVYSQKFHNRKTASGMRFSQYTHTAASVKLPLMSVVKVTNTKNGKSTFVLINDRGPYKTNAVLDLSKATAREINLHSADKIVVEFDLERTLQLFNKPISKLI